MLDKANPMTRIVAVIVMTTPLILTIDYLSATVALVLQIPLLFALKVDLKQFALRMIPIILVSPIGAISMLLYGRPSGATYFEFGYIQITDGSIFLATGILLRIYAMAAPAVALSLNVDPIEMADGLAQVGKVPAVPVLAAFAGMRTSYLMIRDWEALKRARRARGLGDRPIYRDVPTRIFAMLVLALRRGAKLATTMEARGMGTTDGQGNSIRTWARPSTVSLTDGILFFYSVLVPAVSLWAAVHMGTFRWVISTSGT